MRLVRIINKGMIVCVCNRLGSSHLEKACAEGVREACDFYARNNCAMNCGKCYDFVEEFIDRRRVDVSVVASAMHPAQPMQPMALRKPE
jgi:bacterioferritin-associated ferredoxin